jgi:hypothetical protein
MSDIRSAPPASFTALAGRWRYDPYRGIRKLFGIHLDGEAGPDVPEVADCDLHALEGLVHMLTGQWSFAVTARAMRNAIARHTGVRIRFASNIKPKNHRGKLQGGMWNILVRVEDVDAIFAFYRRLLFLTPTTYFVFESEAEAAEYVAQRDAAAAVAAAAVAPAAPGPAKKGIAGISAVTFTFPTKRMPSHLCAAAATTVAAQAAAAAMSVHG